MNRESLEIVQEKVVDLLNDTHIETIDKIELLINLVHFLDPDKYEQNIEILSKELKLTKND